MPHRATVPSNGEISYVHFFIRKVKKVILPSASSYCKYRYGTIHILVTTKSIKAKKPREYI